MFSEGVRIFTYQWRFSPLSVASPYHSQNLNPQHEEEEGSRKARARDSSTSDGSKSESAASDDEASMEIEEPEEENGMEIRQQQRSLLPQYPPSSSASRFDMA